MKFFFGLITITSLFCSTAYSKEPSFVAECWVRCDTVKDRSEGWKFSEFRRYCYKKFNGWTLQDDSGELVCLADESHLASDSVPGLAANCPAIAPKEINRWYARCAEAGVVVRYGWRIGDCQTQKYLRPENIRCN